MNHKQITIYINGKEILVDEGCANLVLFFNENGLKTYSCCEGDNTSTSPFQIMFERYDVTDKDIKNFLRLYPSKYNHTNLYGKFFKWGRFISGEYCENWIYIAPTLKHAERDYKIFLGMKVDTEHSFRDGRVMSNIK